MMYYVAMKENQSADSILSLITLLCLFFLTGCASIPKPDFSALKPAGPVVKVIAAWEPAISTGGGKPMRGFGGRVYFYDQEMSRPIKVDGTVVVYIFDEEGRSPEDSKPNEGIVFDAKTLNSKSVYGKSKMGHSYNLWVPFDSEGPQGPSKKVSLIVRYIPKQGASKVSEQATVYLPGKRNGTTMTQSEKQPPQPQSTQQGEVIRQASASVYASQNPIANEPKPKTLETVTIR